MVIQEEEFIHAASGQEFLIWVSEVDGVKYLTVSSDSGKGSSDGSDVFSGEFADEVTFAVSDDGARVVVASYALDADSVEATEFTTISIPDGEIIAQWKTDERYGQVEFVRNSDSVFRVGSSSMSPFTLEYEVDGSRREQISPESVVARELSDPDLFLSHELVARLEQVVDEHPDVFEPHVQLLLEKVIHDRLEPYTVESHYASPSGSQLFRNLTEAHPEIVGESLADLLRVATKQEPGAASEIAVTILAELAVHHEDAALRIRETALELLETDSSDSKRKGAALLEQLFLEGDTRIDEVDGLFRSLDADLSLPAASSICRVIATLDGEQVDWARRTDKELELLLQLCLGVQDWNIEDPSLEITLTHDPDPPVELGNPTVSSRDFWVLQRDALSIMSEWAEAQPTDVVPYLSWFLRSVVDDRTGETSLRIIESLCEAAGEQLESLVAENHVEILDLLDHDNPQTRRAAIVLFSTTVPTTAVPALKEIADDPTHPASTSVLSVLERSSTDTGVSGENTVLRQLERLPVDRTVSLQLPSRTELQDLYQQKSVDMYGTHYRSQLSELGFYVQFVTHLCDGTLNPRLTELYVLYQYHTGEDSFPSFPTGPRIKAFREDAGMTVDELAGKSGVEASTIRDIEASRLDPTAHTVERLLDVLPNAQSDESYPDLPHPEDAWRAHVLEIAETDGTLPTRKRAEDHSDAPEAPFFTAYDGWNELLESLPIENTYVTSNAPLRENLTAELQELHRDLGAPPQVSDIKERGEYSYNYYKNEFGGIKNAREVAGVEKSASNSGQQGRAGTETSGKPDREELIEALRDVAEKVEGVPRTTDMNDEGRFPATTYYGEFDTWNDALAAAGIDTDRSTRTTAQTDPKSELRADLQRLANELGRIPKTTDVKAHGKYSLGRYYSHYDSWQDAIDDSGIQSP